jgi:hypothetical protein
MGTPLMTLEDFRHERRHRSEPDRSEPDIIHQYQTAHARHDTDAALSACTHDARVVDQDREYRGSEQIREWLAKAGSEFTYTRTITGSISKGTSPAVSWISDIGSR